MPHHSEAEGRLGARVEAQTLYLMEMMRRLGATDALARTEAADAGLAVAQALCAACAEKGGCARVLARAQALDAPPGFCPNGDFLRARRPGERQS